MDEKSIEILEFPEIIKLLAQYTSFSLSNELVQELTPVSDFNEVSLRLKQSAEARHLMSSDSGVSVSGASDIREPVRTAALGRILEPAELLEIQQTLAITRQVRTSLQTMSKEVPLLWDIVEGLVRLPEVEKEIARCISSGGEVLDRASPQLAAVRAQLKETRQHLLDRLEGILRTPRGRKILQEPIITERSGRYVIPVKVEHRKEIRGITHDVSNTGATVYIEPWTTIEMGNSYRELVMAERREIERVLRNLSSVVGTREADILLSTSLLAELDVILAKAKYARSIRAAEPGLINSPDTPNKDSLNLSIKLVDARHPLLGDKAVPLSVEIGNDYLVLVITGPNTGGKTVALKTIGLLTLMTQAGIPIPASPETRLPVFDGVFADIGDEQSIEQTLSSFSWHMGNIVRIIKNATENSLVLLDELGTSTDPAEGSALARSILLYFLSSGILTAATTHFGDLKAFAHTTPGMQNASFDFDSVTLKPTYHMTVGIPGGSNALEIATNLGLPAGIISEARRLLPQGALALDLMLADVSTEKQKTAELKQLLEKEKNEIETQKTELEDRLNQIRGEERRTIQETRDQVVREAAELHRQIRQASLELRKKTTKKAIDAARKSIVSVQEQLDNEPWSPRESRIEEESPISAGDSVYLKEIDLYGRVLSVSAEKQEVEVQAGHITLKVGINSIEKAPSGAVVPSRTTGKITGTPIMATPPRLDLRGKRADEVEVLLDEYLDKATLANLSEVRIIHGIGTGTVRQIVRDFLAGYPMVKSFRSGNREEGRDGVTVVNL